MLVVDRQVVGRTLAHETTKDIDAGEQDHPHDPGLARRLQDIERPKNIDVENLNVALIGRTEQCRQMDQMRRTGARRTQRLDIPDVLPP